MKRNVALSRVIKLVQLLQRPRTLEALADRFGVTERTIRRDLDAIEAAGVELGKRKSGQFVVWFLVNGCPCCGKSEPEPVQVSGTPAPFLTVQGAQNIVDYFKQLPKEQQ